MTTAARPTHVRYLIIALTVCVAVLLYLDRFCLGYVLPYVSEDFHLTSAEIGILLGAFFYTYAFGQIGGGFLSDRFGTRIMLASYLAIWSILTGFMGLANSFLVLVLLRFGCGIFEAGAYPACAGLIRRWFPYEQRGLASGIVSIGGRIGGSIAPFMTGYLMLVFMPLSHSSLISERDLIQPRKLARSVLLQPDKNQAFSKTSESAAPRLQQKMSAEQHAVFTAVAALTPDEMPTAGQRAVLVATINGWLKQPDLFAGIDLDPIKPKLNDQALALFDKPTSARTEGESLRLNRYLLEQLFPGSIRQILGDSWQPVLMIYGAFGVLLAVVFFSFFRNTPRQHFLTNEGEAELAEAHEKANAATERLVPAAHFWKCILTDRSLWASSIVQFGTNFGWIILGSLLALYLTEVHNVPEGQERRIMASVPFLVSVPMMIVGGLWTDWMTRRFGPRIGRAFPVAATRFFVAGAFFVCTLLSAPWPIIIVLCLLSIVNDMGIPSLWAYNLDVGRGNVGLILGWGNMWGNLGAAVSPTVLLWLRDQFPTDRRAGYNAIFLACAGVFLLIGVVSCFIDATKLIGVTRADKSPSGDGANAAAAIREGEPPFRPKADGQ